jgi:hypothetical protein
MIVQNGNHFCIAVFQDESNATFRFALRRQIKEIDVNKSLKIVILVILVMFSATYKQNGTSGQIKIIINYAHDLLQDSENQMSLYLVCTTITFNLNDPTLIRQIFM